MNNKEVIKKLREELEQLRQKIMNLKIFLETEKYITIKINTPKQGGLLREQLDVMKKYESILISRIAIIQNDIDKEQK